MTEKEKDTEVAAPTRPIQIGGQLYLISQPSKSLLASISAVLQKRIIRDTPLARVVNDPAFKLLPVAAQVEVAREAAKVQVEGPAIASGQEIANELMRPESLAYAVWMLARLEKPDASFESIRAGITEENAPAVFAEFYEASGMAALGETPGQST